MHIEGFDQNGISDGERRCYGGDHVIASGSQIWWRLISTEHDEWEPYCRRCAKAHADQQYDNAGFPV